MADLDLLIVGALARDEDVVAGRTEQRIGGAVYFGAYAAVAAGARTGIWTAAAETERDLLQQLEGDGIQVFHQPSRGTAGIRNVYASADRDRRTCQLLDRSDPLRAADLPACAARIIHIAPLMAGEVAEDVLPAAAARGEVALDAQGVLRRVEGDQLVFRDWEAKAEGLAQVTYLKADAAEAEVMTGLADPAAAAMALAGHGCREVLVTRSDAVRLVSGGRLHRAPLTARRLTGRTGRGDTCMASYLARRLAGDAPERALAFAAALTSLKMERPGPFEGTRAEVFSVLRGGARP